MGVKHQWYKYYPLDFQFGTQGLTLEQKGAYQVILNLIYMRQGPIEDDDRFIAGQMLVSVRKWRTIRQVLIKAGNIVVGDGMIRNPRAEKELARADRASRKQAEGGAAGGRKRAENAAKISENTPKISENDANSARKSAENDVGCNENKDLGQGSRAHVYKKRKEKSIYTPPEAPPLPNIDGPDPSGTVGPDGGGRATDPPPRPKTRPRRRKARCALPGGVDWKPDQQDLEHARLKGFDRDRTAAEARGFRDYHLAHGTLFADWNAAWRTWIAMGIKFDQNGGKRRGSGRASPAAGDPAIAAARRLENEFRQDSRPDPGRAGPAAPSAEAWMADIGLSPVAGSPEPTYFQPDDGVRSADRDPVAGLVIQGCPGDTG